MLKSERRIIRHHGFVPLGATNRTAYKDIRVFSALRGAVAPVFNMDIPLVQLADGRGKYLSAPQFFRDVLHSASMLIGSRWFTGL